MATSIMTPSHSSTKETKVFHKFAELAPELQRLIWREFCQMGTTIDISGIKPVHGLGGSPLDDRETAQILTHTALRICHESRGMAVSSFQKFQYTKIIARNSGTSIPVRLVAEQRYTWWNPNSTMLFDSFNKVRLFHSTRYDILGRLGRDGTKSIAVKVECVSVEKEVNPHNDMVQRPLFHNDTSQWVADGLILFSQLQRVIFVHSTVASMGRGNGVRGGYPAVRMDLNGSKEHFEGVLQAHFLRYRAWANRQSASWEHPVVQVMTEEEFLKRV